MWVSKNARRKRFNETKDRAKKKKKDFKQKEKRNKVQRQTKNP